MNRRDSILAAIKAAFLTINGTGGYHTDFGSNVYLWRSKQLTDDNLPACIIRDRRRDFLEPRTHDQDHSRMAVEIEVMNKPGTDGATFARNAIADIYKAIGVDYTFGGLVNITTELVSDEMIVTEEEKVCTGAIIIIAVDFRTNVYQEE